MVAEWRFAYYGGVFREFVEISGAEARRGTVLHHLGTLGYPNQFTH